MNQRPTFASYLVIDWVELFAIGVLLGQAMEAREAGLDALADLTAQALRAGLGWS